MTNTKKERGRPRKAIKATLPVKVMLTEDEKEDWKGFASNSGHKTLASYIKALVAADSHQRA